MKPGGGGTSAAVCSFSGERLSVYAGASAVRYLIRSLRPRALLLGLLALLALAASPALAAPLAPADDVALLARPGYEGAFRPGTWLPIIAELENSGVDRTVELRVGAREGAQYAVEVELPNGGRKAVTVYAYVTPASRRLSVRLLSEGQELAAQTLTLQVANPRARIVALVTSQGATARPPARLNETTPLAAIDLALADLPEQALGLSGFNAIVLEDLPTAELSEAQRAALHEWVLRGGQLIISGGAGIERTLAGLPDGLAPVSVTAVEPVAAESLLGPTAAGAAPLPYASLAPRPMDDGRQPYAVALSSLAAAHQPAVEQSLGRGVVTALAIPLAHPAIEGWEGAPRLWEELLRLGQELPAGFAPENTTLDGFMEGNLAASLTSLPALEFPPLGLLVGLVIAYIVLVGPVTYLILRRLDRQTLGWVVVPIITLLFAGLTYGLGYAQRGGDVLLNQVTLIEPLDGGDAQARVRSFVGLFSPERRAYTLQVAAPASETPLLRPISVQGPWDTNTGGGGVFVQDVGLGGEARGFEVSQWSMRAFASDTIVPFGEVRSEVRLEGERLLGMVENRGATTLFDVTLVQGDQVLRLGDLAAGETGEGELQRRQVGQPGMFGPTTPVSYLVYGDEMDRQAQQGGGPLSPALQQRIRVLDALYNYGPSTRGGQPLLIAWADAATLSVTPVDVRSDTQEVAILIGTPRVAPGEGEIALGAGWLAPRFEGTTASACFGGQGAGLTLGPEPAVLQLGLPRDLYGFQPSEMMLLTASDGPWFDDTTVELYDWTTGSWEAQPLTNREIPVLSPARFLSSHGALRARISSQQAQAGFGCVYIDARLKGALP
jgi:hypothetical protein